MYVTCPFCKGRYYAVAEDFVNEPMSYFRCPFCKKEFPYSDGSPTIDGKPAIETKKALGSNTM